MTEYELMLADRIGVIKDVISKYGEGRFYISFSGGKDSCVLSALVDEAVPGNRIPRVFINTGIEYNEIVRFVREREREDDRFVEIAPSKPIKRILEENGYPFKSKEHSRKVGQWQKGSRSPNIVKYAKGGEFGCPKSLMYQMADWRGLKISDECCHKLKKESARRYERESGRSIAIIGIRMDEGGQRKNHPGCIVSKGGRVTKFKPLNVVPGGFEDWYIRERGIKLCGLYGEPYNFERTGCKGCPYALGLEDQLRTMERYMPNERKQCEFIWKPVYEEYRRIGFRLGKSEQLKLL